MFKLTRMVFHSWQLPLMLILLSICLGTVTPIIQCIPGPVDINLGESGIIFKRDMVPRPECVFDYTKSLTKEIAKLSEENDVANIRIKFKIIVGQCTNCAEYPLIFTMRQKDQFRLIKLPWELEHYYRNASQQRWIYESGGSLCFTPSMGEIGKLIVSVETEGIGVGDIFFRILVDVSADLKIALNQDAITTDVLSETISTYYIFNFSDPANKGVKSVSVITKGVGVEKPCTIISIQDPHCPIFDTRDTVDFEKRSYSMLNLSVMHVNRDEKPQFQDGFALVIVVLFTDERCRTNIYGNVSDYRLNRTTKFEITLIPSPWDDAAEDKRVTWIFATPILWMSLNILILILISMLSWYYWIWSRVRLTLATRTTLRDEDNCAKPFLSKTFRGVQYMYKKVLFLSDYSSYDDGKDFFHEIRGNGMEYFTAVLLCSALFRILTLTATSDMSDCYYNRLCTYQIEFKAWFFDNLKYKFFLWNSLVSSTAYSIVGIAYLSLVFSHEYLQKRVAKIRREVVTEHGLENELTQSSQNNSHVDTNPIIQEDENNLEFNSLPENVLNCGVNSDSQESEAGNTAVPEINSNVGVTIKENDACGIPSTTGLDKALAVLLILEGGISAMYNVCPNVGSYQIEAPFLDMIALLGLIKLHRLRHRSYLTVGHTSIIVFIFSIVELLDTLRKYSGEGFEKQLSIQIPLVMFTIMLVVLNAVYGYYMDHVYAVGSAGKIDEINSNQTQTLVIGLGNAFACRKLSGWSTDLRLYGWSGSDPVTAPGFVDMFVDVIHINIMVGLALHFIKKCLYEGCMRTDLAPLLCYISYMGCYIVQWVYGESSNLFDWSLSQAESGNLNKECLDGVYDANDYTHFYKAAALFSMGMTLTTINDGCSLMKKKDIRVF